MTAWDAFRAALGEAVYVTFVTEPHLGVRRVVSAERSGSGITITAAAEDGSTVRLAGGCEVALAMPWPEPLPPDRRTIILETVSDLVADFVYYDRKEDEALSEDALDEAIESGEITVDEIVAAIRAALVQRYGEGG